MSYSSATYWGRLIRQIQLTSFQMQERKTKHHQTIIIAEMNLLINTKDRSLILVCWQEKMVVFRSFFTTTNYQNWKGISVLKKPIFVIWHRFLDSPGFWLSIYSNVKESGDNKNNPSFYKWKKTSCPASPQEYQWFNAYLLLEIELVVRRVNIYIWWQNKRHLL